MQTDPSIEAYRRGRLTVVLSGVVMSLGAPLVRLLEEATTWQFLTYRSFAIVVMLSVALLWRYRLAVGAELVRSGMTAVLAGLLLGVTFVSIVFALLSTTIANALFMLSTAPLLTALLGHFFLGEAVGRFSWIAIGAALCGAFVMLGDGLRHGDAFGDLAGLTAAVSFAGYSVVLRAGKNQDMLPSVFYGGLFSGITAAVTGLLSTGLAASAWDVGVSFAYGSVGIAGGLALYTLGSRHVPAVELNVLSLGEMVLAPLWVLIAFAEVPSVTTLLGGTIIIFAVVVQASSSWLAAEAGGGGRRGLGVMAGGAATLCGAAILYALGW